MKDGQRAYHTGLAGEDIAIRLYNLRNGQVLAQRARTPAGEIDLIIDLDGETVFVEVKARRTRDAAAYAISPRQTQRIGLAAQCWLSEQGMSEDAIRFDAVLIDRQGRAEILENALNFDA